MYVPPEQRLLEFHVRQRQLEAEAARYRLIRELRSARTPRSYQLRSTTASALSAMAQLIAPPAL